jgi:hypothetical protein
MSSNIPPKDQKLLCLRSGNRCAFPKCWTLLVEDKTDKDHESIIAEMAHIKGEKPNAARYDPDMTAKERNSYDNLILVCRIHHKIIDDQEDTYTVEKLHDFKRKHEASIQNCTEREMPNVTFVEIKSITSYLISYPVTTGDSMTIITPKDKIKKNALSPVSELQITHGYLQVKLVKEFIDKHPDIEFGERLKQHFVAEYTRLKNDELLTGDELFDRLADFASAGIGNFRERAAGLAVLTYFFEQCEVFEK